jgi:spore germination protein GerM
MTRGMRMLVALAGFAVAGAIAWVLFVGLPRWTRTPPPPEEVTTRRAPDPPPAAATTPKIKVRLFYLSGDGMRLRPVEQEIEFGTTTTAQARLLIEAQIAPPQAPLLSAIPQGTAVKELFLTDRGEAYVDLSAELATNHPGGSLDEMLTVYTLVAVLTENLPSVTRVQILIDGREVDTLAGHVDLRRPLRKNEALIIP